MVWIVNEITFEFVSRATSLPPVNEHRVVYTHFWISGKKSHERVTTGEGGIEVLVSFLLISFTCQAYNADIAQQKIIHEVAADIVLVDFSAGVAYITQILVARWNDWSTL